MVSVVDNNQIVFITTEVLPSHLLFKTYNFYGWVESTRVITPSPQFFWSVNVFDTCAAYYEMVWTPFLNNIFAIGGVTGKSAMTSNLTQTLMSDKLKDPNLDCGPTDFEVLVEHESSTKSMALQRFITVS